jgi:hypothetical protein
MTKWIIAASAAAVVLVYQSSAQESPPFTPVKVKKGPFQTRIEAAPVWTIKAGSHAVSHGTEDAVSAMRTAAAKLRDAEGDEAKSKAEEQLRELLNKYFEDDMKRRQAELKEMESRLRKLHEQLERRAEKMDEIIDLQVKVLVNQADGLGFFSESDPKRSLFWIGEPRMNVFGEQPMAAPQFSAPGLEVPIGEPVKITPASPTPPAQPVPAAAPAPPIVPAEPQR